MATLVSLGLKIVLYKNIFNDVFTVSVFMFIISNNSNGTYPLNFSQ